MRCLLYTMGFMFLAVSATAGSSDVSSAYIAPSDRVSFKLVFPNEETRLFRWETSLNPSLATSQDGWTARFSQGTRIVVKSPPSASRTKCDFDRGRIVRWRKGTDERTFPYDSMREAPEGVLTPLAIYEYDPSYLKANRDSALSGKWTDSGRLCFPYQNPNHSGAFYCLFSLAALYLALCLSGRSRIVAAIGAAVLAVCMVATASRGSMIGFAAGLVPVAALNLRRLLRARLFWALVGIFAVSAAVWFGVLHPDQMSRGFSDGGLDWGNAVRLDMLRTAPLMMVDAPGGWGFVGAGRAYFDWYQPIENLCMTGSLMNDHLTILADCGWVGRFFYLFVLSLLMSLSLAFARRDGGLSASVLLAFVVMACFNPIYGKVGLWIVPVLAVSSVMVRIVVARGRRLWVSALAGAVIAVVGMLALFLVGSAGARDCSVRISADGRQVRIAAMTPGVWIVDDGQGAIGGIFACRDIREFYEHNPRERGVGYVRRIEDLPEEGVDRVVLAGKSAIDWMMLLSENPEARRKLPREVVLVSPPFAPSDIPEGVLMSCRVRVFVGEFAARFQPEYKNPPRYVRIVPGMERYILHWMAYILEPSDEFSLPRTDVLPTKGG